VRIKERGEEGMNLGMGGDEGREGKGSSHPQKFSKVLKSRPQTNVPSERKLFSFRCRAIRSGLG